MKRLIALLICLLMVFPAAQAENVTLVDRAIALGAELDALAEDEEYLAQFMVTGMEKEIIHAFAEGERTTPVRIVALDTNGMLEQLTFQATTLPEAAWRNLQQLLPTALVNSLNGQMGSDWLVAAMYLRITQMFPAPDVTGQGVWILYYEDASPVAVSWYAENDAVLMTATAFAEDAPGLEEIAQTEVVLSQPTRAERALQLAQELQVLARSDEYLALLNDREDVQENVRAFGAGDAEPRLILQAEAAESPTNALYNELAHYGRDVLSAVSAIHTSVIYATDEADSMGAYLLLYEEGAPVMVEWAVANGVCWLQATFCPIGALSACRTAADVDAWAVRLGGVFSPFEVIE